METLTLSPIPQLLFRGRSEPYNLDFVHTQSKAKSTRTSWSINAPKSFVNSPSPTVKMYPDDRKDSKATSPTAPSNTSLPGFRELIQELENSPSVSSTQASDRVSPAGRGHARSNTFPTLMYRTQSRSSDPTSTLSHMNVYPPGHHPLPQPVQPFYQPGPPSAPVQPQPQPQTQLPPPQARSELSTGYSEYGRYQPYWYDANRMNPLQPSRPQFHRRRRGNLPKEATGLMRQWYEANLHNPYPSDQEKSNFVARTGLTIAQVNNWFINARRRMPPNGHKKKRSRSQTESEEREMTEPGSSPPINYRKDFWDDENGPDRRPLPTTSGY